MTLPKPLQLGEEVLIEIRRELHGRIYDDHRNEFTKMKEQIVNMTEEEEGLKSILKRIRAGEILVIKTDKNCKWSLWKTTLRWGKCILTRMSKLGDYK